MLNLQQKEMIAGLSQYPAFTLLKQLLKDEIKKFEDKVFAARTPDELVVAAAEWKAIRFATDFIDKTPENLVQELEDIIEYRNTEMGGLPDDYSIRQITSTQVQDLQAQGQQWFGWGNRAVETDPEEEESFQ